jgi:hypothetical protein
MPMEEGEEKKMSHIINLFTIDKILNEVAVCELRPMVKMLYINCLMHHFRDLKATVSNAVAFTLTRDKIPNYMKYKPYFEELQMAELVSIHPEGVIFHNSWGMLIERDELEKVSPEEYVAGFKLNSMEQFKDALMQNDNLIELACMKYKVTKERVISLRKLFIQEQIAYDSTYQNFADCMKHFTYWVGKNVEKIGVGTSKSTGKILGLDKNE